MLLFVASALAVPCEEVVLVDTYAAELTDAWRPAAPAESHERLPGLLLGVGCLSGPLVPPAAAALHRLVAVDAAYVDDPRRARDAAAAARRVDPEGTRAAAMDAPVLARLLDGLETAPFLEGFGASLAARVYVDGVERPSRAVGQPAVVQVFDAAGRPIGGAWVDASEPLPDWVAFPDLACTGSTPVTDLLVLTDRAERAFAGLDVAGFEDALRAVAVGLPCVATRVSSPQAASIHRLEGLRQFTHGADAAALRSFQEARSLDPLYEPPETVVRPESALAALWERAAREPPVAFVLQSVPDGLAVSVDGVPSSVTPSLVPTIVQVSDLAGAVVWTRYVPPGVRLPAFDALGETARLRLAAARPPARELYADLGQRRGTTIRQRALLAASAAAFTAGGALYVRNVTTYAEWRDLDTPQSRLDGLRNQANLAATASTVSLVVGTGLLTAAIFGDGPQ